MPAHHRSETNPYGYRHRKRRAALVCNALGTCCPGDIVNGEHYRSARCDGLMTDPRRMHLAHLLPVVLGGIDGDFINCAPCNQGAGAILGNLRRSPHPPVRHSRVW